MTRIRVRYLVRKGSRYYWQPSAELRALGWRMQRVATPADAERINADVDRWRAEGAKPLGEPRERPDSVSALIRAYTKDDAFTSLAEKTRREYLKHLKAFEDLLGDIPAAAIDRPAVQKLKARYQATPHQGNAVLRTLRLLYAWGMRAGLVADNPAAGHRQMRVEARDQVWSVDDEQRWCDTAIALGYPSMRLAFALCLYTGQRPGDVIRMSWSALDQSGPQWWLDLRQRKTGRRQQIPILGPLRAILSVTERRSPVILVTERGRPYHEDNLTHRFTRISRAAGLAGLQMRDLRRTSVCRMYSADLEVEAISAITGHQLERCRHIVETYLPAGRRLRQADVEKLEAYYGER